MDSLKKETEESLEAGFLWRILMTFGCLIFWIALSAGMLNTSKISELYTCGYGFRNTMIWSIGLLLIWITIKVIIDAHTFNRMKKESFLDVAKA